MKEVGIPTKSTLNGRPKYPLYYTSAPTVVPKGSYRIRKRDRGSDNLWQVVCLVEILLFLRV